MAYLDTVGETLIIALLVFMPAAFGVVHAWSELLVITLGSLLVATLLVKLAVVPEARLIWSSVYLPIGLFLLVVAIQLMPMPLGLLRWVSPEAVPHWERVRGDGWGSVSLFPHGTWHDLRLLIVAFGWMICVANFVRSGHALRRVLSCVAAVAAAVAVLFLVQYLTNTLGAIYWISPSPMGPFGTFVNRNNFSQYMNLSLGAVVALIMIQGSSRRSRIIEWGGLRMRKDETARVVLLVAIAVLCSVAIVFSLSRGGLIGSICGWLILVLMLARHQPADRRRRTRTRQMTGLIAVTVLVGLAIIGWAGMDLIAKRFATAAGPESSLQNRLQTLQDLAPSFSDFPLLGTGQGTFEIVYPLYRTVGTKYLMHHADSDYAELLLECGFIGAACVLAVVGMLAAILVRMHHRPVSSDRAQLARIGLAVGLAAILIHSMSDYGQRLPANFFLTAMYAGLIVSLAQWGARDRDRELSAPIRRFRAGTRFALLTIWVVIATGMIWGAGRAWLAEIHDRRARQIHEAMLPHWPSTPEAHRRRLAAAERAAQLDPGDVRLVYRREIYRLQAALVVAEAAGLTAQSDEATRDRLNGVALRCAAARDLAPTYAPLVQLQAYARSLVGAEREGVALLREAGRLAPNDPNLCLDLGLTELRLALAKQDTQQATMERAVELLRRSLGRVANFDRLMPALVREYGQYDLAMEFAGDNPDWMYRTYREIRTAGADDEVLERSKSLAIRLLEEAAERGELSAWRLVQLAKLKGDDASIVRYYALALELDYDNANWHFERAQALMRLDRVDEAIESLRTCIRFEPYHQGARQMLSEVKF